MRYNSLQSTLKFAIRNLLKNKITSIFNLTGLTLAFVSLLYILFYIRFEVSYDRFHENYKRIYNVYFKENLEGVKDQYVQTPMGLGTSLLEDFPEVENMCRTNSVPKSIIKSNDGKEYTDNVIWGDSSFFNLFKVRLLTGTGSGILNSPNQICISSKCARKYFSGKNPIGKTLVINDQKYEVKAIFDDFPENSHLSFDLIGSLLTLTKKRDLNDWDGNMYNTYIKLRENVDPEKFEKKLEFIITDRLGPFAAKQYHLNIKEWFGRGNKIELKLMPLHKIHLYASNITGFNDQNNINDVILIIMASVFILFIACFNFINFNISLSRKSSKTVGIKKISGSRDYSISIQAFFEAVIIFLVSSVSASIIIYSLHVPINEMLKHSIINWYSVRYLIPIIFCLGILIAFVCGYLPSLRNAKKKPASLLKNNIKTGDRGFAFNHLLLSLQFTIAIVILITFLIINNQVNLITSHELGFNKENVLIIHRTNRDRNKAVTLAGELRKLPGIKTVSVTNAYPGDALPTKDLQLKDSPEGFTYSPQYFCCDSEMIHVLNLKLVKGNFFSENSPENSILLNETALNTYDIKENPIGKIFTRTSDKYTYTVIGVVKDFNFRSLHKAVEPLIIYTGIDHSNSTGASKILVKLANNEKRTLDAIKDKWHSVYKDAYFEYSFLDDKIDSLYAKEMLMKKIIPTFTLLAFLISIIGLIGITYIKLDEKIKEIGIRKVNGARIEEVITMLNKDIVKWIAVTFIIASPIAWYAMRKWLENFAYKTELSWWVFAMAGAIALVIALFTVSWQSWRAATRNPVEALKYE